MPKKKHPVTPEEQAAKFRREARKLEKAGLLTPTEGETALDAFVRSGAGGKSGKSSQNKDLPNP
jgi:hypothetical protein